MRKIGNNALQMREHNLELVKSLIYKYPNISRLEIASMLSLTPATITSIVNEMMEDGLICEDQLVAVKKNLGRPKIGLRYDLHKKYLIGVDCTSNQTVVVLCSLDGEVLASSYLGLEPLLFSDLVAHIASTVNKLLKKHKIKKEQVMGLGFGNPGKADLETGVIISSYQKDWIDKNFYDQMHEHFSFPIFISNNVQNRAWAIDLKLTLEREDSFCYFFSDRGTSCPFVIRNHGATQSIMTPGQMGHFKLGVSDKECPVCGKRGCLDAIANNPVIVQEITMRVAEHPQSMLYPISQERPLLIGDVIAAEKQGEHWFDIIINEVTHLNAIAISNIVNLLSPDKLYIDYMLVSGLGREQEFEQEIRSLLLDNKYSKTQFEFLDNGVTNGARGAALLAFRKSYIEKHK